LWKYELSRNVYQSPAVLWMDSEVFRNSIDKRYKDNLL
jgi:hypothetical protein